MYTPIILFFTSLISIVFMIGRKLPALKETKKEEATPNGQISLELPYLTEVKKKTVQNIRKHGYATLVTTLRWYIRVTNFLKYKYGTLKTKIKNLGEENKKNGEKKEISKFLKVIGDYKQKIKEIKHRIRNEENL